MMNSIFVLLLLLCCCNHGDESCGCEERRSCGEPECGCRERRSCGEPECGCRERRSGGEQECGCEDRRPCGTPGQNARRDDNPFSPFTRDHCDDQDYPPFRGNKGPCGCEDTQDA